MNRHPFATAGIVADDSELEVERERMVVKRRSKSVPPRSGNSRAQEVASPSNALRPNNQVYLMDPAFTLRLEGQEVGATRPVYGRSAAVDGSISFANPSNIIKVEVKIEGFAQVRDFDSGSIVKTPLLSDLLVFWDAPNRSGGYSSDTSRSTGRGTFSPIPGSCPSSFTFKSVLPTHYTESDGQLTTLPPSFSETLPGFYCDIRYDFCIYLTRMHDMKVTSMHARWKRKAVYRKTFEYRPRSRPSRQAPFPPCSKTTSKGPITRFCSNIQPSSPFVNSLRTLLYLPSSQVVPLCAPIPFFVKLYGPDWLIRAFDQQGHESFLPRGRSDSIRTICGIIQHHLGDRLNHLSMRRLFDYTNGFTRFGDDSASSSSQGSYEKLAHNGRTPSRVQVVLFRQVSVDDWDEDPKDDYGQGDRETRSVKNIILGEGTMYTADISCGSITWAGEVAIDPRLNIRHGGFRTRHIVVRDMLLLTVRNPSSDDNSTIPQFQQVIPVQLTTDPYGSD